MIMDWLAYSSNLNLIENVWYMLKEVIYKKDLELGTLRRNRDLYERLVCVVIDCWEEIKVEVL